MCLPEKKRVDCLMAVLVINSFIILTTQLIQKHQIANISESIKTQFPDAKHNTINQENILICCHVWLNREGEKGWFVFKIKGRSSKSYLKMLIVCSGSFEELVKCFVFNFTPSSQTLLSSCVPKWTLKLTRAQFQLSVNHLFQFKPVESFQIYTKTNKNRMQSSHFK